MLTPATLPNKEITYQDIKTLMMTHRGKNSLGTSVEKALKDGFLNVILIDYEWQRNTHKIGKFHYIR